MIERSGNGAMGGWAVARAQGRNFATVARRKSKWHWAVSRVRADGLKHSAFGRDRSRVLFCGDAYETVHRQI
jgi:hypothetical protein